MGPILRNVFDHSGLGDETQFFPIFQFKNKNQHRPPPSSQGARTMWRNERPCTMSVHAVVMEPFNPLLSAVMERGMLAGHRFHVPEHFEEDVRTRFKTTLITCPEGLQPWSTAPQGAVWFLVEDDEHLSEHGHAVRLHFDVNTPKSPGKGCDITVHDLLPPPAGSASRSVFEAWMKGEKERKHGGYWCSLHDVASAISKALPFLCLANGSLNIAGRRYWTGEDTYREFMPLVHRSEAGKTGSFTQHHLSQHHDIPLTAVDIETEDRHPIRPSIGEFHRFLEKHTGEGWRPIMPLRQSLMLVLAALTEETSS
jgi:hypothetical protein